MLEGENAGKIRAPEDSELRAGAKLAGVPERSLLRRSDPVNSPSEVRNGEFIMILISKMMSRRWALERFPAGLKMKIIALLMAEICGA